MHGTRLRKLGLLGAAVLAVAMGAAALADEHGRGGRADGARIEAARPHGPAVAFDGRYGHDHAYPSRGSWLGAVPPGAVMQRYRGQPYYFHGGAWYRPYGSRLVVVAPPFGLFVPFLPPFYTTVWFGGIPYYYANDTYYLWNAERRGYIVTEPPSESATASAQAPAGNELYVYPKNGQSEEQLSKDRYECHAWARAQTGFDPTEPQGGVDQAQNADRRAAYRRAEGACLEGRGYTVR